MFLVSPILFFGCFKWLWQPWNTCIWAVKPLHPAYEYYECCLCGRNFDAVPHYYGEFLTDAMFSKIPGHGTLAPWPCHLDHRSRASSAVTVISLTHRIHETGIFTYRFTIQNQATVGKYTDYTWILWVILQSLQGSFWSGLDWYLNTFVLRVFKEHLGYVNILGYIYIFFGLLLVWAIISNMAQYFENG